MPPQDTKYHLEYLPYRRSFERPMEAAWGTWATREGLLLKLDAMDASPPRFGEIAPLPTFGSESLETARAFLDELGTNPTHKALLDAIAEAPVSTAAGLSMLLRDKPGEFTARTAALVNIGNVPESLLTTLFREGFSTIKVKLGYDKPSEEWKTLQSIVSSLQKGQLLRLDPNGSWENKTWRFWRNRLPEVAEWIEFLEEPFQPGLTPENWLQQAESSPVPLALDESLAGGSLIDWCECGWTGYWIVKPSLLGNPARWMSPLSKYKKRVIISSVFETGIGLSGLIRLAGDFPDRDHGLGTQAWFNDGLRTSQTGPALAALDRPGLEEIWKQLSKS